MNFFNFFMRSSKIEDASSSMTCETKPYQSETLTETASNTQKQEETMNLSEENKTMNNQRVYNLIILDQSGSMQSIYAPALSGVNETLQTIRMAKEEHPEQEHFVTLVAFDGMPQEGLRYNIIYDSTPASEIKDITSAQYRPYGNTPLFDAMGKAINELRDKTIEEDVVLVTIITDGYENASREYTGSAIKSLVEEMRKKGWVFTYIGANQDVDKVAESMAINNRMAFRSTREGTQDMFMKENVSRRKFFSKLSGLADRSISREDLEKDFFENI